MYYNAENQVRCFKIRRSLQSLSFSSRYPARESGSLDLISGSYGGVKLLISLARNGLDFLNVLQCRKSSGIF